MTLYRVSAQSLEVLSASSVVPGAVYRVDLGSDTVLTGWNQDTDSASTTIPGMITSTGSTSTVTYECPAWDSVHSDGVAHADLPSAVSARYLKWYGGTRTIRLGNLNDAKTYTLTLYSSAPGSVSIDWSVGGGYGPGGGTTKALVRESKQTWTGVVPSAGYINADSGSSISGSDVTLSALILTDETGTPSAIPARISAQSLEALVATYEVRACKTTAFAVLTSTNDRQAVAKTLAYAVLDAAAQVTVQKTMAYAVLEEVTASTRRRPVIALCG